MLTHSRRTERQSADGQLRTLPKQDRSRWDWQAIIEGHKLLEAALGRQQPGRYQIEAAIAAVHCEAPTADATDWAQIAALYDSLREVAPSPITALNHAVAIAEAGSPAAPLALADTLGVSRRLPPAPLDPRRVAAAAGTQRRCSRFVMTADGGFEVAFHREYREIVPNERDLPMAMQRTSPPGAAREKPEPPRA